MKQRTRTPQTDKSPLQNQLLLELASEVQANPGSINAAAQGEEQKQQDPGQVRDCRTFWQLLYSVRSSLHLHAVTACVQFQLD